MTFAKPSPREHGGGFLYSAENPPARLGRRLLKDRAPGIEPEACGTVLPAAHRGLWGPTVVTRPRARRPPAYNTTVTVALGWPMPALLAATTR